jgi:hypothetical protein
MRRLRFHVRALMIVVAVVAAVLGGALEWKRTEAWRRYCRNQADFLAFLIEYDAYWSQPEHFRKIRAEGASPAHIARLRRNYERWHPHAAVFVKLSTKWRLGSWLPWIEIEPDPAYVPQTAANVGSPFMPREIVNH